jgi:uncharacterized protein YqgV (UPF0045/DUF77 family)
MDHIVNISLQVLPTSKEKRPYDIVDKAIAIIKESGINYKVCPFETVMEGNYDKIMEIIKHIQTACLDYGAESLFSNIKIQIKKGEDVWIEDKMKKYNEKGSKNSLHL